MKRILDLASDHLPTIRNLARLYERAGRYRELHRRTTSWRPRSSGDTKQVLSLHHRNAEILDEHLKDRAGAIAAYERRARALPLVPARAQGAGPALRAGRAAGTTLIRMYRAEAEIAASTEQAAALIYKIGELYEHRLKNENEAIASLPGGADAGAQLLPGAARAGAHLPGAGRVGEPHRGAARRGRQPHRPAGARQRPLPGGRHLGGPAAAAPDMAIEGYQEVLRLTPGHAATLRALERLYAAAGQREGAGGGAGPRDADGARRRPPRWPRT